MSASLAGKPSPLGEGWRGGVTLTYGVSLSLFSLSPAKMAVADDALSSSLVAQMRCLPLSQAGYDYGKMWQYIL